MRGEGRMHRMSRLHQDEDGVAMVIAMMVVFIVVLLSIVIFDLSIHNTQQAAYDRKRVTSIAAAESGIDRAWNLVQFTAPEDLPCTESASLGTAPGPAGFDVTYTWYDAAGDPMPCTGTGRPSQEDLPTSVLVTSVGETIDSVPRTMQAYMTLAPTFGGFDAAIISVTNTIFNNNFTVTGGTSNDGDVYITNGNLTITNSPFIYGNVYVPTGSASIANNAGIVGNLWANGSVTMNNDASVTGDMISSTSSLSGIGTIGGDATAGTSIADTLIVGGTTYPSSPQGPPPSHAFPLLCNDAISGVCTALPWTGYTRTTVTTCAAAQAFLDAVPTGDQLLWIPSGCTNLAIANNDVISFSGSLAIVTNGSITMANRNNWNGMVGKNLYLMANYRTGLTCSSGAYNITTGNNSNFVNASVLFYSPCTVTLNNQNDFTGQVFANTVTINNHFTLNATPVLVPGAGDVAGFDQSIVYLREVVN
jgi:Tfp pilus assembly protein PilX